MWMSVNRILRGGLFWAALLPLAMTFAEAAPAAEAFRVDTKVYSGGEEEPISQTSTLFHEAVIYDFPAEGNEVTIFAPKLGRIVILDTQRRIRTEVSEDRLYDFSSSLREWAAKQEDGLTQFAVDPRFDRQIDAETGNMSFASRWMTYELRTMPASTEEMATQYIKFCDVYSHLNTLLNPGSLPPFGRLEVNRQLQQSTSLPVEIRLTIPPAKKFGNREIEMVARHRYQDTLSNNDLDRIEKAGVQLTTFRQVSLSEFRGVKSTAESR